MESLLVALAPDGEEWNTGCSSGPPPSGCLKTAHCSGKTAAVDDLALALVLAQLAYAAPREQTDEELAGNRLLQHWCCCDYLCCVGGAQGY